MEFLLRVHIRATITATILSGMPTVWAQTVYRCAHLYSDRPCPGAVAIDARDSRTPQQKLQSDGATQGITRTADQMERERRALERAQWRSTAGARPFPPTSAPRSTGGKPAAKAAQAKAPPKLPDPPFTAISRVPPPTAPTPPARPAATTRPGQSR